MTDHVSAGLEQAGAFQERQFYVPLDVGWRAIFYNKQIFAEHNLAPPETWEEFLAICETLLTNGEVPLSLGGIDAFALHGWFEYLNLRMNGAQFYRDLLAGKERYDDPRVYAVMETWQSLFVNGYFIEQPDKVGAIASRMAITHQGNDESGIQRAVMVLGSTHS